MRDRDVRVALLDWLSDLHAGDPDTKIVEEMGVWSGTCRIDVAVINGELTGFELKSERDTLQRLPTQAEIYGLVFDKIYLVSTTKHLAAARNIVPKWWGQLTVKTNKTGSFEIHQNRVAKHNPKIDSEILASLLWKDEAISLLDEYGLARGNRSKSSQFLHRLLADQLDEDVLRGEVRSKLKQRNGWLGQVQSQSLDMPIHTEANPLS